jgi:Tol biopolymer transport system component
MWFNHTVFNRNDTRFFFLARTRIPSAGLETGMFTANLDGSELRQVIPYGNSVSHFDWRNDREIIATFKLSGDKRVHILFTDGQADYQRLGGGCLDFDGHCSFSPDQQWLATDHKTRRLLEQSLTIYHIESGQCYTAATLDMQATRYITGDLRCDFHPRWNRDGKAICFDAINAADGSRQLHIAHLDFDRSE